MKKFTLLSLVSLLLLGACTVEKRVYRNGYNIQWHTSLKVKNQQPEQVANEEISAAGSQDQKSMNETRNTGKVSHVGDAQISTLPLQGYKVNAPSQEFVVNQGSTEKQQLAAVVQQHFVKESSSKAAHHAVKVDHKKAQRLTKALSKTSENSTDDVPMIALFILCFIFPPLAVGLATDWDTEIVIYNILWTLLCGFPGIIHALIIIGRYR
ncbi:MAG: Proteolipid rane potential modulator [Bacteroidota bacterium]|jgi:uncharacterized membrane protein YqaE (UPF0057 family)